MTRFNFPPGFAWGVATSAYQIEGATEADGRGESIWDRFCQKPGAIADGSDGKVACDHYHRWAQDVALMKDLSVKAYRFSIAWPRILPSGRGFPNPAGLDFYERLVDGLLAAGIRPVATLYHWDLPQMLQDAGGWAARDTGKAFADYTDVVSRRLGDRVDTWVTHNEPWCIAHLGHHTGEQAPGHKNPTEALTVAHHVLLSHGWAVPILRGNCPKAKVGITLNLVPAYPASGSDADREAARHFDGFFNRWYLDPLYRASYPADVIADRTKEGDLKYGQMPWVKPGDLATIAVPTDFLGVNFYSRAILRSDKIDEAQNAPRTIPAPKPADETDMGWEVYPDGLRVLLGRLHRDYHPKEILITENGAAYAIGPDAHGRIPDAQRQAYFEGHLRAVHEAIGEGVPVGGYYAWSFMDNFEWAFGYAKRFGLVYVDFATQARLVKDSARFYAEVIRQNALTLEAGTHRGAATPNTTGGQA